MCWVIRDLAIQLRSLLHRLICSSVLLYVVTKCRHIKIMSIVQSVLIIGERGQLSSHVIE